MPLSSVISSYLVNDFYRPFINKNKSQKHYVHASRIAMILLTIVALLISTRLSGIFAAYKYITVIMGGAGTVLIARWYWWRVNAWSEISAIVASFIVGNTVALLLPDVGGKELFSVRLVITLAIVTPLWIIVTFLTSKEPSEKAMEFYSKMKISGPGWNKVIKITGVEPIVGEFTANFVSWLSCVVFILALMLGIGKFLFHEWTAGIIYMVITVVSGCVLRKSMAKMEFLS